MSEFKESLKVEITPEQEEKMYQEYKKKRYEQKKKQMELHRELVNEMRIDKGGYER